MIDRVNAGGRGRLRGGGLGRVRVNGSEAVEIRPLADNREEDNSASHRAAI